MGLAKTLSFCNKQYFINAFYFAAGICFELLCRRCLHVAGSPYQFTVGKVPSGGTHKVEFGGPGVETGEVGAKS